MNDGTKLAILAVMLLAISLVAASLGLTTDFVELPTTVPEPDADAGFFATLLLPFRWVWTAVVAFVQLMTFQMEIPVLVNTFFTAAIATIILVFTVRIIRGGG